MNRLPGALMVRRAKMLQNTQVLHCSM